MSKLTEKELQFCEMLYSPDALIENLIPQAIDSPHTWGLDCRCLKLHNFQYLFLNYAMQYADDYKLSDEENWQLKLGAGKTLNIGARNSGKSLIGIDCDTSLLPIWLPASEITTASFDDKHLNPRTDRVAQIIESNNFFKIFSLKGQKKTVTRGAKFKIHTLNGTVIKGANEKSGTPQAGIAFEGMHSKILYYDEAQQMSDQGTRKRIDAVYPGGQIARFAGIPELIIGSPLGKLLSDPKNKNWIVRLPQYVRPDWTDEMRKQRIEEFDGESSLGFKLNVLGELIEGALGKWDMERIRSKCLKKDKSIKIIEISKDNYHNFETILKAVERPATDQIFICSDIGTTASPSELIIISGYLDNEGKRKFKYEYNIPLFNLTTQQQAKVFKYLYDKMGTCFISLDCTNADGRAIADELNILGVPEEHITRCLFGANIVVGFETDKNGKVQRDKNGNVIEKKENTLHWANKQLDDVFYSGQIELPYDPKFLKEFAHYFQVTIGNTTKYGTSSTDHLVQSFQTFAIVQFLNEFKLLKNKNKKRRILGVTE